MLTTLFQGNKVALPQKYWAGQNVHSEFSITFGGGGSEVSCALFGALLIHAIYIFIYIPLNLKI